MFFFGGLTPSPFCLLQNGLNPNLVCCNGPEVMGERFHLLFRNWVRFLLKTIWVLFLLEMKWFSYWEERFSSQTYFSAKNRWFPVKHCDFPANMAIFLRRKLIFSLSKTGDFPIAMLLFERNKHISFWESSALRRITVPASILVPGGSKNWPPENWENPKVF